ncbi:MULTISPECIES: AraC family transcriptional regulator [unclassified Geodermatophilus]|uniref:helix-turn-helix transcriptional regulator n=1 Tax=unclassified Geodermatophilus TaxID=2637632 RepID=UPI003EF072E0
MQTIFESDDLDATQAYLSGAYSAMRLSGTGSRSRARIDSSSVGSVGLARIDFGFDMDYTVEPTGLITIGHLRSGTIPRHVTGGSEYSCGPGDLLVFAAPDQPCAGRHSRLAYDLVSLDPTLLARVAAAAPDHRPVPVRLLGHRPVGPVATRHLQDTLAFLRDHVLAEPELRDAPLIAANAGQLLAAAVLTAFPNTALTDPTATDRCDATPGALRRAVAFIDENAHRDISVADIAAAAHVTIRALQYAFARHHGTTPTGYLRQARLAHAHQHLVDVDPSGPDTVTAIAARWGFAHAGRFAALYRQTYGRTPRQTLRGR